MKLLIKGINPEPWRAPQLGVKHMGRKVVPAAYKDENLRGFQTAVFECVEQALFEQGIQTPVYPKGTFLAVTFAFWRQLESYEDGATGRRGRRHYADATNLLKAAEDALQGLLYANDRDNRQVMSAVVESTATTEPMLMVCLEPHEKHNDTSLGAWAHAIENGNGVADKSKTVWIDRD